MYVAAKFDFVLANAAFLVQVYSRLKKPDLLQR
jgi:hypothetical protein